MARLNRNVVVSATRYGVTGMASLIVDVGGLMLLHEVFGIWVPLAATMSFLASFVVNFTLNRNWSFAAVHGARNHQLFRFTALVCANSVVVFIGMTLLVSLGMNYLLAKCILVLVTVVVNFFVMRFWVFATPEPSPAQVQLVARQ
jgi:putative flippase GtrA